MKNYFEMGDSKEQISRALEEISEYIRSLKTTAFSLKVSSLSKAQESFYGDVAEYYQYEAHQLWAADDYQNDAEYYLKNILTDLGIAYEIEDTWAGKKIHITHYHLYL